MSARKRAAKTIFKRFLTMSAVAASKPPQRGTFVVFEGVDRAGKSTQCKLLAEGLRKRGREATLINFPDRTTGVGQLIDKYLRKEVELDDRAVHLMFSANRWEAAQSIKDLLESGVDVVCDRYAFSGVAFSAAKESIDDLDWCKAPDAGLPAPDVVVFLEIPPEKAEARSGFGNERYEVSDMQVRVAANFNELVTPCWPAHESNFPVLLRIRTCTPSTRRLLDSVTAWVPHRSIQWTRPHRRRALTRPHRRRALDSLVESRRCWRKIDAARPIDEVRADVERCVLAAAEVACSSPVKTLWED